MNNSKSLDIEAINQIKNSLVEIYFYGEDTRCLYFERFKSSDLDPVLVAGFLSAIITFFEFTTKDSIEMIDLEKTRILFKKKDKFILVARFMDNINIGIIEQFLDILYSQVKKTPILEGEFFDMDLINDLLQKLEKNALSEK